MTHYPITSPLWEDPELGLLRLHFNARARRLVFRAKEDGLHVTLPIGTTSTDLQKAIEELKSPLLEKTEAAEVLIIPETKNRKYILTRSPASSFLTPRKEAGPADCLSIAKPQL